MLLRILEIDRGPLAESKAFNLEVLVELLEDEEGVRDADGPFVEAASGRYARGRVFIDEASQRGFELLVGVWQRCGQHM